MPDSEAFLTQGETFPTTEVLAAVEGGNSFMFANGGGWVVIGGRVESESGGGEFKIKIGKLMGKSNGFRSGEVVAVTETLNPQRLVVVTGGMGSYTVNIKEIVYPGEDLFIFRMREYVELLQIYNILLII
jgi:hypothetical protein